MILLVDVGNSRTKWACWDGTDLGPVSYAASPQDLWPAWRTLEPPQRVVGSNVAGAAMAVELAEWVQAHWQLQPEWLAARAATGDVKNAYAQPGRLGADRWAALLAAWDRYQRAVIVVDAGTAITLDVLDHKGQHLGGLIAPGVDLMRRALEQGTQMALDPPDPEPVALLARDTQAAILGGTWYAAVALIDRVVADVTAALPQAPARIISGGAAARLAVLLAGEYEYLPDIVLEGLAVAAGQTA